MSRGIQPEILATFEEILPEHRDLDEYLQAIVAQERSGVAQHTSSDTLEDEADIDFHRALILSFIESQNQHIASQSTPVRAPTSSSGNLSRLNSFDSELDAAIALSFEEAEEPVSESLTSASDDRGASPTEPSDSETVQDDIDPDDMTFEQLQSLEEAIGTESTGLSKELLDSFPVLKVIAKSGWFSSTKSDPEGCSICFTEYEVGSKLLTLPCLHLYHKSCIKEWLKDHKTCPICNTDLSVTQA
ncbi:hypothetical protein QQ045_009805 [Rhodiola kirilowii]